MRKETDAKFIERLINCGKLPSSEVVAAQLDWVLTAIRENCPRVEAAPYVANGHKTLRETANDLRRALETVERTRILLAKWSEAEDDEAKFYRQAIDAALQHSALVPDEIISTRYRTYRARRVDRLLPCIPDGLADELRKISAYTTRSRGYTRYDPNERMMVQLLWLVFETSGRRVTLTHRGSATLSPFQHVCVVLFERAGFNGGSRKRAKPTSSTNLPNRIRDHVAAGRSNKRLYRIKDVMIDHRISVEEGKRCTVPTYSGRD